MNTQVIKLLSVSISFLAVFFIFPETSRAALTVGSTSITTDSTLSLQGGNVGIGDLTPAAALVIGDDTGAGVANGVGDLYVQNDLEVDGSITGTLKVSGFDGTMYNAVSGNLTAISGMSWSNTYSALAIGNSVGNDGKLQMRTSGSSSTANNSSPSQLVITVSDNGVVSSGNDTNYGQFIMMSRRFATGGTIETTGSYIQVSGDNAGAGTHSMIGQYIATFPSGTNPDTSYGLYVDTYTGYSGVFMGGNVGIDTATPTGRLDVNSTNIRIRTAASPDSAAACNTGEISWDINYIYVCTASGAWKRAALTGGY